MKTRLITVIVGLVVAPLAVPAAAQSTSGFYVGGGLGISRAQHACTGITVAGAACDDTDSSGKIFGGYQFNRNLSVEAGAADLGHITETAAGASGKIAATALELSAIGTIPMLEQWSAFGRLGAYRSRATLSGAATGTRTSGNVTVGLGIQYDFGRSLGLRGEVQRYQNVKARNDATAVEGSANVTVIGASLVWRFF